MNSVPTKATLAVDAMGGDFGIDVTVPASVQFLRNDKTDQHKIILVGNQEEITEKLKDLKADDLITQGLIEITHASEVVEMDESPALALKRKKDSSMRVAINLVKEGVAQASVSAGNTGALMATARFVLKTIRGIDRPAIISSMPCRDTSKTIHMLDLGANVDSTPDMLLQFAVMGSVLTRFVDKKENPRVALLNVGAEEIKGSEKVKKASSLLEASPLINYTGYIEADEIYDSKVDVIVTDGFEGNVALKASEGTAKMIVDVMQEEFKRNALTKFAGLLSLPILKAMKRRLDPRTHNGATLLGLNGVVVKSHGGTDELGFLHAIHEAFAQADLDLIGHLSEQFENISTIES
ncbi:phosphate acyltransferase PlsX [Arenicella sp. 4NH20-0111]|uniref:phosphate acyltransferase PlsX n=1 Tax=Arenicella sp. 4NH20-0111 TaxID=3127648 RepID=UPI003103EC24